MHTRNLSVILMSFFALSNLLSADSIPLQGAVAFRFDDNKSPEEYRRLYEVFSKHQAPFSLVVNPLRLSENKETLELLRTFVQNGSELVDHSPSHSCMKIEFSSEADALAVKDDPGVDHIEGKTVFLKYRFNDKYRHNKKFTADLKNNHLENIPEGMKKELRDQDFLIFPDGTVYGVHLKDGMYTLCSPYDRPASAQDSEKLELIRTDRWGLQMTQDAYRLLAGTSIASFEKAGLPRPKSFASPGGWGVFPSGEELASIYGKEFAYKCGDSFNRWSGTYNRPEQNLERFRQSPNWDSLERLDLEAAKAQIANLVAKHRVSIFISHLWHGKLAGGLDELLQRNDKLLAWLRAKNIPVLTIEEVAAKLFDSQIPAGVNIMPPLSVDLDENGLPDGYEPFRGAALKDNCIVREDSGELFSIRQLSGIKAGINTFSAKFNAPAGSRLTVKIGLCNEQNPDNVAKWLPDMNFDLKGGEETVSQTFEVPAWCPGIDVICIVSGKGSFRLSEPSITDN